MGYISFVQPFSISCLNGNLYIDLATEGGRARYALLLTARAARLQIARIDYTQDTNGTCWVELAQL